MLPIFVSVQGAVQGLRRRILRRVARALIDSLTADERVAIFDSAQPGAADEASATGELEAWRELNRREPPAEWLALVRKGAPQLLQTARTDSAVRGRRPGLKAAPSADIIRGVETPRSLRKTNAEGFQQPERPGPSMNFIGGVGSSRSLSKSDAEVFRQRLEADPSVAFIGGVEEAAETGKRGADMRRKRVSGAEAHAPSGADMPGLKSRHNPETRPISETSFSAASKAPRSLGRTNAGVFQQLVKSDPSVDVMGGVEEAAEEGNLGADTRRQRIPGAKALVRSGAVMPGLKSRPISETSFFAACKAPRSLPETDAGVLQQPERPADSMDFFGWTQMAEAGRSGEWGGDVRDVLREDNDFKTFEEISEESSPWRRLEAMQQGESYPIDFGGKRAGMPAESFDPRSSLSPWPELMEEEVFPPVLSFELAERHRVMRMTCEQMGGE